MRISDVLVDKKINKSKRKYFIFISLIITGILSFTLVVVTYFGFFTGDNYIVIDKTLGDRGIYITKNKDLSGKSAKIVIEPVTENGIDEISDNLIDFNIRNSDSNLFGIYSQLSNGIVYNYAVYQFYLINESNKDEYILDVNYQADVVKNVNGIKDAIGYRSFVDSYEDGRVIREDSDSGVKFFKDQDVLDPILALKPNEVKRITMFFWLDGNLTTDKMIGGSITLKINLSIGNAGGESNA